MYCNKFLLSATGKVGKNMYMQNFSGVTQKFNKGEDVKGRAFA